MEGNVYMPEIKSSKKMEVDESVYLMRHQASTEEPCLSFDVIPDHLGIAREIFPMTMYIVAGTQSSTNKNNLLVMKMFNLHKTQSKNFTDGESSESENEDELVTPKLNVVKIKHQGCVNRVRCAKIGNTLMAASWSEFGNVSLWDLNEHMKTLENPAEKSNKNAKPILSFKGHLGEGYGLDWCPTEVGTLASGDCKGHIHIWKMDGLNKTWKVDQKPYNSHAPHSVEDLQWSPNERHLMASCSGDKSIKIWDTRASPQSACMLSATDAHTSDVNVISWNKKESQFLLSGGDDGFIRVWDLRQFSKDNLASPMATFKQHHGPVTTIEWHHQESTVFAAGGADDQITLWDLAVEAEHSNIKDITFKKLPPQLLFIHQGIEEVKELHWHPQCPSTVISTALSGFDIFRTFNV